ncbi:MAG: HEPN domain-containing protein [Candidatus Abyssobacteria bacterium SURF_17]|uniref:HEPN domain-containing protein n=1 Tax=Candidatus Abyssobacteria bacterium SURF_17 TaxID=2093361 RepID=A0A419F792_9BACT|nr:MAG: HEPN domain-containing protein [Candidatus Abyssubacteria bacterium SURF_17]
MDEALKRQALEWFERGRRDIETAQLLFDERGYTDSIAYHIQQAIEKSLKGYLVLHGRKPPKIHELDTLLKHIQAFDNSFDDFMDLCEKSSRYYIEDRYPPGPPAEYSYEEIKADLDEAWTLISTIRKKTGD